MIKFRKLNSEEINVALFHTFQRRQEVTKCWRKVDGKWIIKEDPFIDDWSIEDYEILVRCLKHTVETDGLVYGAFIDGALKGFVSVEGELFGSCGQYLELSSIHISQEFRGQGIGKELFMEAKRFAKQKNAKKLYISAHSAIESQAFYRAMGCSEAKEYNMYRMNKEPFDCQLECEL